MSIIQQILSGHVYPYIDNYLNNNYGNYFEIGVFNGVGFANTACNHPNKRCIAVDPFIEDGHTVGASKVPTGRTMTGQRESALAASAPFANAEINIMTSHEYKDQLTQELIDELQIGCVLIDGNHHYEFVVNDYQLAIKLIDTRAGCIIFDDVDVSDVARAYNEFKQLYRDRIEKEEHADGGAYAIILNPINE